MSLEADCNFLKGFPSLGLFSAPSQFTIESIHDVVFFPFAQVQLGYLLCDAARCELRVTEVGIT